MLAESAFECWMAQLAPTAAPLLYKNSSEFESEHTLVKAYVSWGFFWVCSGPWVHPAIAGGPADCLWIC